MNHCPAWMQRTFSKLVRGFAFACLALSAQAAPITLEEMMQVPDYAETQLSGSGRYLAVLVPIDRSVNLSVIDLDTRKILTRVDIPGADIRGVQWVGDDNLLFSKDHIGRGAASRYNTGGMFLVSRDGKVKRKVTPTIQEWFATGARRYVYQNVVDIAPEQGEEVIVSSNVNDEYSFDLYRLNVLTGQRSLITPVRPKRTQDWLLDGKQVPRVVVTSEENTSQLTTWYRENATAPWRELWRSNTTSGVMNVALHVQDDGQLLVSSNEGRDTMAVYRYDPQSGERKELLAADDRFDVGADASGDSMSSLVLDPAGRTVVGVSVRGAVPRTIWIDPDHERLQAMLDGALPGMRNVFSRSVGGSRTLVRSYSDRKPSRWYLLDGQTGQMRALFVSAPWLDKGQLVAMKPVTYKTRDGLEIASFLFEPASRKPGEKLPLVIQIHGGPWIQAHAWGAYSGSFQEAQLLASRGYAVLMANFRGTLGLGRRIYQSARGEFGLKMQEDIEDAADWAVAEGVADARRMCLVGGSYGGYASLMGLVKTPDKYRCAIAGFAVTDLEVMISSGWSSISRDEATRRFWTDMVGDPKKQAAQLNAVSPARQAQRIKGAVMLYGSAEDRRVPFEQMELMRAALRANGKDTRWIAKYGEGHGIGDVDSAMEIYGAKFDFLKEHLAAPAP